MIRATIVGANGERTVLLGLSQENVKRLTQGQPIRVDLAQMLPTVPAGTSLVIHYGETEETIAEEMRQYGLDVPAGDRLREERRER